MFRPFAVSFLLFLRYAIPAKRRGEKKGKKRTQLKRQVGKGGRSELDFEKRSQIIRKGPWHGGPQPPHIGPFLTYGILERVSIHQPFPARNKQIPVRETWFGITSRMSMGGPFSSPVALWGRENSPSFRAFLRQFVGKYRNIGRVSALLRSNSLALRFEGRCLTQGQRTRV